MDEYTLRGVAIAIAHVVLPLLAVMFTGTVLGLL